jgi:hypothetical protein
MKITPKISKSGISSYEQGFEDFFKTLRPSLKLWDFFVNWDKVFRNTKQIEIHLNIWRKYSLCISEILLQYSLMSKSSITTCHILWSWIQKQNYWIPIGGSGSKCFYIYLSVAGNSSCLCLVVYEIIQLNYHLSYIKIVSLIILI